MQENRNQRDLLANSQDHLQEICGPPAKQPPRAARLGGIRRSATRAASTNWLFNQGPTSLALGAELSAPRKDVDSRPWCGIGFGAGRRQDQPLIRTAKTATLANARIEGLAKRNQRNQNNDDRIHPVQPALRDGERVGLYRRGAAITCPVMAPSPGAVINGSNGRRAASRRC